MQDYDGWKKIVVKNRWPQLKIGTPIILDFYHKHNRFFKATPYYNLLHSCKESDLTFTNRKLILQGIVLRIFQHQHTDAIMCKQSEVVEASYYSIAEILATDTATQHTFTVYLNAKSMEESCVVLVPKELP